jgi:hypothetical protein
VSVLNWPKPLLMLLLVMGQDYSLSTMSTTNANQTAHTAMNSRRSFQFRVLMILVRLASKPLTRKYQYLQKQQKDLALVSDTATRVHCGQLSKLREL